MQDINQFTDDEIIEEMNRRFIVPQWYKTEHIVERCKECGMEDEDKIETVIYDFKKIGYTFVDDALIDFIENQ